MNENTNKELLELITSQSDDMAADDLMAAEYEESIKPEDNPVNDWITDDYRDIGYGTQDLPPPYEPDSDEADVRGPAWSARLEYGASGHILNRNGQRSNHDRFKVAIGEYFPVSGSYRVEKFSNPDRMDQCRECGVLLPLTPSSEPCEFPDVPMHPCHDEHGPIAFERPCECNGCLLRAMGVRTKGRPREYCSAKECQRKAAATRQRRSRKAKGKARRKVSTHPVVYHRG